MSKGRRGEQVDLEKIENINNMIDREIETIRDLPVISGYYLVLGGGKIGSNFTEYSVEKKLPFVLVIDKDRNAPAANNANIIKDTDELISVLENASRSQKQKDQSESSNKGNIYFYNESLEILPFILSFGMPEFIVPAVPYHAAAYLVSYFLQMPMQHIAPMVKRIREGQGYMLEYPQKSREQSIVREISITDNNRQMMAYFDKIVSHLPANIIAGKYPADGVIMLSYAKEGEICPNSCIGPESYCPNFNREKERTVTEYVDGLRSFTNGWIFESYQMKGGIGGIGGSDFKEILLGILDYAGEMYDKESIKESQATFFVATTCNCHGVLNLFKFI